MERREKRMGKDRREEEKERRRNLSRLLLRPIHCRSIQRGRALDALFERHSEPLPREEKKEKEKEEEENGENMEVDENELKLEADEVEFEFQRFYDFSLQAYDEQCASLHDLVVNVHLFILLLQRDAIGVQV